MSAGLRAGIANDGYLQINGVDVTKITLQGITTPPVGQCRFQYTSSSVCTLVPYQGNQLTINGQNYTIPSAGVTIAVTGLTATSLYFIYAYMNSTTMTLEASATGHSTDTTTGVEIKTGDPSRSLVGMVRIASGPIFANAAAARFVVSWFNRRSAQSFASIASTLTTSLTTPQPLIATEFLSWGSEAINVGFSGGTQNSTSLAVNFMAAGLDSSTVSSTAGTYAQIPSANQYGPFTLAATVQISTEGYHYIYAQGWTNAGVASFISGCTISMAVTI